MEKNLTPEIRFRGFTEPWREVLLSDCLIVSKDKNALGEFDKDDVLSVSDEYGVGNQIKLLGRSYAGKSVLGYKIIKQNDVVYTKSPLKAKPFGIIKSNQGETGIVSVLYAVYNTTENVNADFISLFFEPPFRINNYLRPLISKGAKNTINISDEVALNGLFPLTSIEEQNKVCSFLFDISSFIFEKREELNILENLKEACIERMFPHEGETAPRLRFKGFTGDWDKNLAANVFATTNVRNRPDLPVLSANQDIRGMSPRSESGYNISHDKANEVTYKVVEPGQFVIHLRSFQGGFAHSAVKGITSPAYTIFGFKDISKHDDYFWKIIFMSKGFIKRLETITYGIRDGRSIKFDEFSEMSFYYPSFAEQRVIGLFFRNLDKLIAAKRQEIEKLKDIKQSLLDKMFV